MQFQLLSFFALAFLSSSIACGATDTSNQPLVVSIAAPIDKATFLSGETVVFAGSAMDAEEGALTGALRWTSSIDGEIGTGTRIEVTTLSAGHHVIRLTATDARGSSAFVEVTIGLRVQWAQIAVGGERSLGHSCGISVTGDAYCWGLNFSGQLGIDSIVTKVTAPRLVSGQRKWTSISAGSLTSCGVVTSGDAYCWGANHGRWLSTVSAEEQVRAPALVVGGHRWITVQAEGLFCGITTAREMYCWSAGSSGATGDGTNIPRSTPTLVAGGHTWSDVSVGSSHVCGVTNSGEAYCWGRNDDGRLGTGSTTPANGPARVLGSIQWSRISAGLGHTCGVTVGGEAYCWGSNLSGELATAGTSSSLTPLLVTGGHQWSSVTAGSGYTCGVTIQGQAFCWGYNEYGQLGDGTMTTRSTLAPIVNSSDWLFLNAHTWERAHTCGVRRGGEGYCWGYNVDGQLGDGTITDRPAPARVVAP